VLALDGDVGRLRLTNGKIVVDGTLPGARPLFDATQIDQFDLAYMDIRVPRAADFNRAAAGLTLIGRASATDEALEWTEGAYLRGPVSYNAQFADDLGPAWKVATSGGALMPEVNLGKNLGGLSNRVSEILGLRLNLGADASNFATITPGTGTPEGFVTAKPGSLYLDLSGALYLKTSGTGNTGWTLK
jgi:hypothetical protein